MNTEQRTKPKLKLPNPRLHDSRDPRSYLGDPEPTDHNGEDMKLFSFVFTSRIPVSTHKITPQTPITTNQSKP